MSSKHPIDALFKKELKEHKIAASEQAWDRIAAANSQSSKKGFGIYLVRAATVTLLLSLSAVVYFNRNAKDLMDVRPVTEESAVLSTPKKNNTSDEPQKQAKNLEQPAQSVQAVEEPALKESPKGNKKVKKNTKARLVPLMQPAYSDPILAFNDIEMVEYDWSIEETETIEDPDVLRIKVSLPEVQGDYKTNPAAKPFGERLWAYATNQFDRVVAGESPELPSTENASVSLPIPDFIDRRFLKKIED